MAVTFHSLGMVPFRLLPVRSMPWSRLTRVDQAAGRGPTKPAALREMVCREVRADRLLGSSRLVPSDRPLRPVDRPMTWALGLLAGAQLRNFQAMG